MNHFRRFFTYLFGHDRSSGNAPHNRGTRARLGLEALDERCVPSSSPLTWSSNHNLYYGSGVVLTNVENYQWSSAHNIGFALQQGGTLDSFTASSPSHAHATLGTAVQSIGVASDGTLYALLTGGQLQVSTNSGSLWTVIDTTTEQFGVANNGALYDMDAGGTLQFSSTRGSAWTVLDTNSQKIAVTPDDTLYNLVSGGVLESSIDSGQSWKALDSQTVSFGATSGDVLYSLDGGGQFWVIPLGGSKKVLDTNTEAFVVTPWGTVFNLYTTGNLKFTTNQGSNWTTLDGNAQSFQIGANGAIYTLDTGGALRLLPTTGGTWQTLDTATASFDLATNGTLYDLDVGGVLRDLSQPGAQWDTLDTAAQAIGIAPDGTFYATDPGGVLWDTVTNGGYWPWQANNVTSFTVASNGTLYALEVGGTLQEKAGASAGWIGLDNICLAFGVSANGTLYDLNPGGQLWELPQYGSWSLWDSTTQAFTLTANGTIIDLDTSNALWALPYDGYWQWFDGNTQTYAVAANGTLYNLLGTGTLESSTTTGASWKTLATTSQAFDVTQNGTIENLPSGALPEVSLNAGASWYELFTTEVPDSAVSALAQSDFARDGQLTQADVLGLFNEVEANGALTAAECTSLQELIDSAAVAMPVDVRNLASKVINGNSANDTFQGESLGDIWTGSAASQLNDLVGKWFYGTDLPTTDIDPTTGTNFPYAQASGSLFGPTGAPSYNDVAQGYAADCYFLAALGQLAVQSPQTIENMFVDNGDGTYTVRFYNNGVADYVTVNSELPVNSQGQFVYAGYDQYGQPAIVNSGTNVLWVALAEKAYAQLAEEGWSRADHGAYANAYDSIGYGWPTTVSSQLTGSMTYQSVVLAGPDATPNAQSIVLSDMAQEHLIRHTDPIDPTRRQRPVRCQPRLHSGELRREHGGLHLHQPARRRWRGRPAGGSGHLGAARTVRVRFRGSHPASGCEYEFGDRQSGTVTAALGRVRS
jgi:hypothetical protein